MIDIDPNTLFYGNGIDASCRLDELEQFLDFIPHVIEREADYFRTEAHIDIEREFLPLFTETFPPIVFTSVITSSVMLLEFEVRGFCDTLARQLGSQLRLSDLRGNLLDKFKLLAVVNGKLDIDTSSKAWRNAVRLFEVRNCLLHNYGVLDEFSSSKSIEMYLSENNVSKSTTNTLQVDRSLAELALQTASQFIELIYSAALKR
jgi:hypothetical protein